MRLISKDAFAQYMKHRDFTVRSLAEDVQHQLIKQKSTATCSSALIGHLRSGQRNTCKPETAHAIERCLGAPPGSLFVPQVSRVSRDVSTTRKAS